MKMLGLAIMLALLGASLHALQGPVRKNVLRSKERLADLHASHEDLKIAGVELQEMREDLAAEAFDIAQQEKKLGEGHEKLAKARADLQSKWLIPSGLRASLHGSFELQSQLLEKLDAVMQRSKKSIAHAQEQLPSLEQTINELYVETGNLELQGQRFVAKFDRPLHHIITRKKTVKQLFSKVPSL